MLRPGECPDRLAGGAMTRRGFRGLIMLAALGMCSGPVFATRMATYRVTGQVTAITAGAGITVAGHKYAIATGSPAAEQVRSVHVNDVVDLTLDGQPSSTTSRVLEIRLHRQ